MDKVAVKIRKEYKNSVRCGEYMSHITEVLREGLSWKLQK
jgi:hypothetical protein